MVARTFVRLILISALCGHSILAVSRQAGTPVQGKSTGSGEPKDVFAIYLAAGEVPRRLTWYGEGDWSHVRLADSPLIAAEDILEYDFARHSIRLRPEALARIPHPGLSGTPFVLIAHGQRIYLGAFVTKISSFSCAVPSIVVGPQDPAQPKDTIVIDRAYPAPSFGVGPDPRGDDRIKAALIELHKLRGEPPAPSGQTVATAGWEWGPVNAGLRMALRPAKVEPQARGEWQVEVAIDVGETDALLTLGFMTRHGAFAADDACRALNSRPADTTQPVPF